MMSKVIDQPYLRFKGFTGSWERTTLGDISSLITKGTTPSFFSDDGVTFVKIESLNGHLIEKKFCAFITKEIHEKELRRSRLEESDILFAIAGATVGKVGVVEKDILPANTNQALAIIRLLDKTLISFVLQILTSKAMKKYIYQSVSVGAQPNLSLKQISEFTFNSPSLPEQQKIASFLSSVDERIELLERKKEKLEAYKKGVMQQIFPSTGSGQAPQIRFKQDNGSEFPDWEEKRLGDLTFKTGKKNRDGKVLPTYSINNLVGFLPQSEQFDGIDSFERGFDTKSYKIVEQNMFAYNPARINVGSYGFSGDLENVLISSLYVCFKTKAELDPLFLFQFMKTELFKKAVLKNTEGGVRDYLFYENFSKIKINLPCTEEQGKITAFLISIDQRITEHSLQIQGLRTWKKGLLQQMFV